MTKKNLSKKKVAKGLLFGSLFGGAATLLFAPRSGKETQQLITQEVDETIKLVTTVKKNTEEVQVNAAKLNMLANDLIPDFINSTQKSVERFEFRSKYRINDIKDQIEKINTEINDLTDEVNE